jgi:fatty acid-binding protein DegV
MGLGIAYLDGPRWARSVYAARGASLRLGLLALGAAELAESGWRAAAFVERLTRVRARSGLLLTVDTNENRLRSGRVSRGKARLAGMVEVAERLRAVVEDGTPSRDARGGHG